MKPETVSELYPSKWLSHDDLNGRAYTVDIDDVQLDEFYNKSTQQKELKAFLVFSNAQKHLILNVTQCHELTDIFKSEKFKDWRGPIIITPGRAPNGKPTIKIQAKAVNPPTNQNEKQPAPATVSAIETANESFFDD